MAAAACAVGLVRRMVESNGTDRDQSLVVEEVIVAPSKDGSKQIARLKLKDAEGVQLNALLASQLLPMVLGDDPAVKKGALVKPVNYILRDDGGKRFILVSVLTVVKSSEERASAEGANLALQQHERSPATSFGGAVVYTSPVKSVADGAPLSNVSTPAKHETERDEPGAVGSWVSMGSGSVVRSTAPPSAQGALHQPSIPHGRAYQMIQALNPYQNQWIIRGKVTQKQELRRYQNARGEGSVCSFVIADASGSIKVTGFGEAAETVNNVVQQGRTYAVSNGMLKPANPQYNRTDSMYEMTLTRMSMLRELDNDKDMKVKVKLSLVKFHDLAKVEAGRYCDVIGVVQDIGDVVSLTSRTTSEPLLKRTVTLVDDSKLAVPLTLWRGDTELFAHSNASEDAPRIGSILLCRGVRRGDFNGICLDGGRSTSYDLKPNIERARVLKQWYRDEVETGKVEVVAVGGFAGAGGSGGGSLESSTERSTLAAVIDTSKSALDSGKSSAVSVTRVRVTHIRSGENVKMWYPSCPGDKKKMHETGTGMWRCEACEHEYEAPVNRYILSLRVADATAEHFISVFDDFGRLLIGCSADEMAEMERDQPTKLAHMLSATESKLWLMRLRAKEDTYKDEKRIRYTAVDVRGVDYASESRLLLEEIKAIESSK